MTSNSTAEHDRLFSLALADISAAKDSAAVEQLRVGLLGRQGRVTAQLKLIASCYFLHFSKKIEIIACLDKQVSFNFPIF